MDELTDTIDLIVARHREELNTIGIQEWYVSYQDGEVEIHLIYYDPKRSHSIERVPAIIGVDRIKQDLNIPYEIKITAEVLQSAARVLPPKPSRFDQLLNAIRKIIY